MSRKGGWFRLSSVTVKIITVNVISLLICTMGVGMFHVLTFQDESVHISADRALSVAQTVSVVIDGDNLVEVMASGEKNALWLHEDEFVKNILKQQTDLTYLYVVGSDYDDYVTYYMSGGGDLGETDPVASFSAEMFQTIQTGEALTTGVYTSGDYGTLVSGFAAVHDDDGNIVGIVGVDVSLRDVFSPSRIFEFIYVELVTFILCMIVPILLQVVLFRRMIGRPIKELTTASAKIGSGDLDASVSIHTGDEIEELSETLTKMTMQLKEYIVHLTEATAEKERIEVELNIARQIQMSMLPRVFPKSSHFDMYAMVQPAKEVGGDFYDFFLINDHTLAVVIADVSGKGVPSALFMAISKMLIKNNAQYGKSPKDVFETVNNMLCENNEASMFVTAFLGYLDVPSGVFTFVNAGHNPALLRSGERFDWLKAKSGFVLASMEDMVYTQKQITLQPGDELFLYTDGVTEAANHKNELFGDLRLFEMLNKCLDLPLDEITGSLKREIDAFSLGVEQTDDISMLVLRYHGFEEEQGL
jgi:sigma-B regulation protein RsbU (phosphoserine phosphatase)